MVVEGTDPCQYIPTSKVKDIFEGPLFAFLTDTRCEKEQRGGVWIMEGLIK
jgi:hypothetical protein